MLKLISIVFFMLSLSVGVTYSQKADDSWLRLITGEDYTIEIDKNSLNLKDDRIINANFRTSYASPEAIDRKPDLEYQKRIDSIDFRIVGHSYRIVESTTLDANGEVISKTPGTDLKFKQPIASAHLFYFAATKLAPFGSWKVLSCRYVSGEGPSNDDPVEIRSVIGTTVSIRLDNLFIGRSNCPGASFDFKSVSDKDLERYGFTLKSLGIDSDTVKVINAGCESNTNFPRQTLIFLQSPTKATMLWDGVLFEIERLPNQFS